MNTASQGSSIRRRSRKINTCLECQRLKRRCSRTQPCEHCQKTLRACVFPAPWSSPSPAGFSTTTPGATDDERRSSEKLVSASTSHRGSETDVTIKSPPSVCLQIGRLSVTERIGGTNRENIVPLFEEILQQRQVAYQEIFQFSAPIVAWFKPQLELPLDELLSGTRLVEDGGSNVSEEHQGILMDQFYRAVYPVCPLATDSDFYGTDDVTLALRAAVLYAASASMPILESQRLLGVPKATLVKTLKSRAESAICRTGVFRRSEVKLFQALIIYLTPQFLADVSQPHSVFLAALTRHFQLAGYDRDCPNDGPTQTYLKRHLWNHLLFLNIRATEAVGPERTLVEDLDVQLPEGNDCILAIIRYECYKLHRTIFKERENMRHGRMKFTTLMDIVDKDVERIQSRYLSTLDHHDPPQRHAAIIGTLLLARAQNMVLQTQWRDLTGVLVPGDLRDRSVKTSFEVMEAAVALETEPALAEWEWYSSAFQQYHSILYPLAQAYLDPNHPDSERTMTLANHIFGPSSTVSVDQRSGSIIRSVKDAMASFLAFRKGGSSNENLQQMQGGFDQFPSVSSVIGSTPEFDFSSSGGELEDFQLQNFGSFGPRVEAEIWSPWPMPASR